MRDVDDEVVERERRQLALMRARIDGFRAGTVSLGGLIEDLEGLLAERTLASDDWVDEFRSAWGDLEIPYAVALDRLDPIPGATDPVVAEGLAELDRLITTALAALE